MTFINNPLLIQYFDHTPHAGVLPPSPSVSVARHGVADNEGLLELSLDIRNDHVATARFRAYGPPAYIAAGEWLCATIEGCSVSDFFCNLFKKCGFILNSWYCILFDRI